MVKDIDPKNYRPVPSLPLAIVASYRGMTQEEIEKALFNYHDNNITLHGKNNYVQNDIHIHMAKGGRITPIFIGNYERFDREVNLDQLLKEYGREQPANDTIFKNKIVFVGGSYDKRDFYYTPLGRMSGLEVVANITQSILSGTLITHMSFLKAFIIELILGSIVAVIFVLTSPCRASIICFIALIPAIVLASYLAFSTSYYWFDFVPTIAGVMVHGYISKKEKGRGKVMEGEGVANFARAFQHAGARSVVVSLWSVASNKTVEFMKVFYGYLKAGKGKAEALRLARNEIKAKYPNPYFWSPFILHGEG